MALELGRNITLDEVYQSVEKHIFESLAKVSI
jgi:hypothetical protein